MQPLVNKRRCQLCKNIRAGRPLLELRGRAVFSHIACKRCEDKTGAPTRPAIPSVNVTANMYAPDLSAKSDIATLPSTMPRVLRKCFL
mmetsp:Transcript_81114/g.234568  ORF Transcript_81114/g.234568 Transcript_81114/m.234568 type:complete len:88 (-) Transcript_81114:189-452(-)